MPTLPPPGTPLDELLGKPLRTPPPASPFAELLKKPSRLPTLGEVVAKAKRLRPKGGKGNLSVLGFLLRLAPLALFPSPIGDQPDDPALFGEKLPGDKPPVPPRTDAPSDGVITPPLGTVTVSAPRPRAPERPRPFGAPNLIGLPVDFFSAPFPIKPKTSPFPSSKKRKGTIELKLGISKEPKKITLPFPFPLPSPMPSPVPNPRPQPQPKPLPFPGGASPPSTGQKVCSCRIVDPAKKKRKKKKSLNSCVRYSSGWLWMKAEPFTLTIEN